jgi:hypothetical protein
MKFNMGINVEPQLVKINAQLQTSKMLEVEQLLKEFKDVFCMDIQISERDSTKATTTHN